MTGDRLQWRFAKQFKGLQGSVICESTGKLQFALGGWLHSMSSEQSKQIVCIGWNMFTKCVWTNATDKYIWKNQSLMQTGKILKPLSKWLCTNHSLSSRHELDRSQALHVSMAQTSVYNLDHLTVPGPHGAWLYVLVPLGRRYSFAVLYFLLNWTSSFFVSKSFVEVAEVTLQLENFVTQSWGNE